MISYEEVIGLDRVEVFQEKLFVNKYPYLKINFNKQRIYPFDNAKK